MKFGMPVTDVVHLGGIAGLDDIIEDGDGLRLGSLVTHDRLARAPLVARRLPALAETWRGVANIRIRCKGTIGGNLMSGEPGYDFALAALAAGARLEFLMLDGTLRIVMADEPGAAETGGLLTAIVFPATPGLRLRFDRSLRPVATIALGHDAKGGRLAIGCAYRAPVAIRLPLDERLPPHALAPLVAASLPEPVADHEAGSAYRRRMIEVLLRRNLEAAA